MMLKRSLLSQVQNTNQDLLFRQFKWERRPSTMYPLCVILVFFWIKLYPMIISANCASPPNSIWRTLARLGNIWMRVLLKHWSTLLCHLIRLLQHSSTRLLKCLIDRLQLVHNTAARVVTCTRKYDHITPVLKRLHWLPVSHRIIFKILLLIYIITQWFCS